MIPSSLIPADAPKRATAAQLARWLGVSRVTIYNWVQAGRLPEPCILSRKVRWYEVAQVRAYLDGKRRPARRPPRGNCHA